MVRAKTFDLLIQATCPETLCHWTVVIEVQSWWNSELAKISQQRFGFLSFEDLEFLTSASFSAPRAHRSQWANDWLSIGTGGCSRRNSGLARAAHPRGPTAEGRPRQVFQRTGLARDLYGSRPTTTAESRTHGPNPRGRSANVNRSRLRKRLAGGFGDVRFVGAAGELGVAGGFDEGVARRQLLRKSVGSQGVR